MKILYNNHVTLSTTVISVFSENPLAPFDTALRDSRLSRQGRTLSDSSEWIKFDFGSAKSATYCCILNHNFTGAATVVLEANTTDSWATPPFSQTIPITDLAIKNFTSASYRWWRITIADAANPDAEIRIGNVFIGTELTMPGFDQVVPIKRDSSASVNVSQTGQVYGEARIISKGIETTFPGVDDADRVLVDALFDAVNIYIPFILLLWENSLDVQPPIYARLTNSIEWQRVAQTGLSWSTKLGFQECF